MAKSPTRHKTNVRRLDDYVPSGEVAAPDNVAWVIDTETYKATCYKEGKAPSGGLGHEVVSVEGQLPVPWLQIDVCDVTGVWCWVPTPLEAQYVRATARVLVPHPAFTHACRMGSVFGGRVVFPLWWHQLRNSDSELVLLPKHCLDLTSFAIPEDVSDWSPDLFWKPFPEAKGLVLQDFTDAYIRALALKSGASYGYAARMLGVKVLHVDSYLKSTLAYRSWGTRTDIPYNLPWSRRRDNTTEGTVQPEPKFVRKHSKHRRWS